MTKSTYWLRGGQGKATIGLVSEEGEHYQQGNTGDEEKRKINPPIAVAITRISECWELLLLPPGLLPPRVPLCPPPLPSIWKILTPSLTLTFLWHLPSTPPFTWLLKSLPSRWQTFLKPLTSEQSFSLSPRSQTVANVARPTKRRSQLVAERDGEQLASSGSDRRRSHSLLLRMILFCFLYGHNISGQKGYTHSCQMNHQKTAKIWHIFKHLIGI